MTGDEKHSAAAHSTLDVLWVLYDRILDVSPVLDERRRTGSCLSKGHGPMAYYAVLAAKGFVPGLVAARVGAFDSPLGFHPDRNLVPGVEIASGSLGHGFPLAVGTALGLRAQGIASRVVCLVGDAELDEGSNPRPSSWPPRSDSTPSPSSSSTTGPRRTPCRAGSRRGSRSMAGTRSPSTAATTPRSRWQ